METIKVVGAGLNETLLQMFNRYLERWQLVPDGEEIITPSGRLLPVLVAGKPAMLKVTGLEKHSATLMDWWNGEGAARVLVRSDDALLMERATSGRSLVQVVRNAGDDEASRIACMVVAKLHAPRAHPPPALTPLAEWFKPLAAMARAQGGALEASAKVAAELLSSSEEEVVLHGDIHHANILDFGPRGWLAIDPKGLVGERYFDYVNLFCNPNIETATAPGRFRRQIEVIATAACLQRHRLLAWAVAWAGLSAAFEWEDGSSTDRALALLQMMIREMA